MIKQKCLREVFMELIEMDNEVDYSQGSKRISADHAREEEEAKRRGEYMGSFG